MKEDHLVKTLRWVVGFILSILIMLFVVSLITIIIRLIYVVVRFWWTIGGF